MGKNLLDNIPGYIPILGLSSAYRELNESNNSMIEARSAGEWLVGCVII